MERNIHYLEVILKAMNAIEAYVQGVGDDQFLRNEQLRDACLMRLIVIGEYGGKITGHQKPFHGHRMAIDESSQKFLWACLRWRKLAACLGNHSGRFAEVETED